MTSLECNYFYYARVQLRNGSYAIGKKGAKWDQKDPVILSFYFIK